VQLLRVVGRHPRRQGPDALALARQQQARAMTEAG
jgi:hypothetical protein